MKFEQPKLTVIEFDVTDIITVSVPGTEWWEGPVDQNTPNP